VAATDSRSGTGESGVRLTLWQAGGRMGGGHLGRYFLMAD
jgi:hypothetical protein